MSNLPVSSWTATSTAGAFDLYFPLGGIQGVQGAQGVQGIQGLQGASSPGGATVSVVAGQILYSSTGTDIVGDSGLTYDATNDVLTIGTTNPSHIGMNGLWATVGWQKKLVLNEGDAIIWANGTNKKMFGATIGPDAWWWGTNTAADNSLPPSYAMWLTAPTGDLNVRNNITAFASDRRLKENIVNIDYALDKVSQLNGVSYNFNELAYKLGGFSREEKQIGLLADEVQKVLPDIVKPAPFDTDFAGNSKSGDNYMTIQYEKLVPLLVEAIKELKQEVDMLKAKK